ncbi:hypothetical protein [Microvirga sp. VF16]|uniref:hypothetical protein n=1 Tax=Microvirga sp. VF16 TaxID=2807101 RepID=UPI00193D61BF|nr:hypothetical protein [Microvirga sp. VF16]QRM27263.1 hypothetical protein JO965_13175 [Microvirga sp. VF16]
MGGIIWPEGKSFAFTVFDDTDSAVPGNYERVYALLRDNGLRTTKSVWPLKGKGIPVNGGATCEDPEYLAHMLELQTEGFEIGFHGTTYHSMKRPEIERGLDRFRDLFGSYPKTMANHTGLAENMYWGAARLTGAQKLVYNILMSGRNPHRSFGHCEGSDYFWGDLCRDRIVYVRNFVTSHINTLKSFPQITYHDPARPYVRQWFSSSEGSNVKSFVQTISEKNQDCLEEEGGACIMYAHFAFNFEDPHGQVCPRFQHLIRRLAKKNGWFVPVGTLLDYIRQQQGDHILTDFERSRLERNWLLHKICVGGTT